MPYTDTFGGDIPFLFFFSLGDVFVKQLSAVREGQIFLQEKKEEKL